MDFDFQADINCLPFKLNMGTEANMTHDQQGWFNNLIPQLQGEVCKCLDTWLRQGIIRPSQSPYTSQVVIV